MTGTVRTIAYLEERFETGKKPTEADFYDLIATLQSGLSTTEITTLNGLISNLTNSIGQINVRMSAIEQFNFSSITSQITQINNSLSSVNQTLVSLDSRLDALEGSTTLPACTGLVINSITVNSRTSISFDFAGQNLTNVNWNIRNASNAVVNSGNITAGPGTVNLTLTNALPDATYSLSLVGVSCVGTVSQSFAVNLFVNPGNNICEVPTTNSSYPAADTNRYVGSVDGISIINEAGKPKRIFMGGWVIDKNNAATPQKVDIYIDTFYMGTTVATQPHTGAAAAYNVDANGRYRWQFDFDHIFWWRNGQNHTVAVKFHGTSTQLGFYNPNNDPNIDKINVSEGFDGVAQVYPSAIAPASYTGTVIYEADQNPDVSGRSKVPFTTSYNYLRTNNYIFGTCNDMGGVLDYFSRVGSTLSGTRQEDAGLQVGIDPYIGDANFLENYYRNTLGYTSSAALGEGRNWNGLPQGVYESHVNGGIPNGSNFGGFPTQKTWDVATKTLYSKADLWQYNYAKNGAKVYADGFSETWHRVVADNVLEIRVRLTLNIPYLSGYQSLDANPFGFFDRAQFPVIRHYSGSRPFQYQPLQSKETATLADSGVDARSEYYSPLELTEKWIGIFNQADTEGVSFVWDGKEEYKASVHDDMRGSGNPRTIIYNEISAPGQKQVMPIGVVERKFYLVLGGSLAARQFAYDLHRMPCTP